MRWTIIRLIWLRELRDQLRDRRTILMIVVLPVLLYPILGVGVLRLFMQKPVKVGVSGVEHLPQPTPRSVGLSPQSAVAWFAAAPEGGVDQVIAAAALSWAAHLGLGQDLPALLVPDGDHYQFFRADDDGPAARPLEVVRLDPPAEGDPTPQTVDRSPLETRKVDVLLVVPADFTERVRRGEQPAILLLTRQDDERSVGVRNQVYGSLVKWQEVMKKARLFNHGLPANFDQPFRVDDPERDKPLGTLAAENLMSMLSKVFPFMLVLWSLTGALYPAVDLCAGEKERGTMETLLISPAGREEIVYGKFLTIWVFSAFTALLNLASIGLMTWLFSRALPVPVLNPASLAWCVLLLLPLSAFFSAVCLSLGAYARSSKEGQYYLMPLFLVTLPLIILTLVPGVELNPLYSLIPVTGVALLLQKLMTATRLDEVPWVYFIPVLAPTVLYGWLALRWAVMQFHREEVLFREAERLDVGLWLRRMFREKEPLPSFGQAMFCFTLIAGLRAMSLGFDSRSLGHTVVDLLAFVLAPPVVMALVLTAKPAAALQLRRPPWRAVLTAVLLAAALAVPLAWSADFLLGLAPNAQAGFTTTDPAARTLLEAIAGKDQRADWLSLGVLAVLAPVCEEVAFRGFILSGLRRRFKPWTAVLLSGFLFAVAHLNVFLFVPLFILGVILGLLATRSGSVVPGLVFHVALNGLLLGLMAASSWLGEVPPGVTWGVVLACGGGALVYLGTSAYRLWAHGPTVHADG